MNYFKMNKEDVCNGEGLRVVLWLSGCSHKCKGCQNPQTWDANSGIPFDKSAKEKLFGELDKDYISGLTLTGGDPLFDGSLDDVLDLVTEVNERYPKKSIWLYSGYTWKEIMEYTYPDDVIGFSDKEIRCMYKRQQIIYKCNILIDGQYVDSQRDITLPYRGSKNQKIIDVKHTLKKGGIVLWKEQNG